MGVKLSQFGEEAQLAILRRSSAVRRTWSTTEVEMQQFPTALHVSNCVYCGILDVANVAEHFETKQESTKMVSSMMKAMLVGAAAMFGSVCSATDLFEVSEDWITFTSNVGGA